MKVFLKSDSKLNNQKGAVAPLVVIFVLFLVLPLAVLTVDVAHLYVVRNQLQNAADASALAGAAELYDAEADAINADANDIAYQTLIKNFSEGAPVDVIYTSGLDPNDNNNDIQRGHWAFKTDDATYTVAQSYFKPNPSLTALIIAGRSTEDLNHDDNFINAVRVKARPDTFSVVLFFARIFGIESLPIAAESVAYLGFAGSLGPGEVDLPIAICKESILDPTTGNYDCNIGRMINSGGVDATHNTGGWTDFSQPCSGGTNASDMSDIIIDPDTGNCSYSGNPDWLTLNKAMGATGGEVASVFTDLISCWKPASNDILCDFDENHDPITTPVSIDENSDGLVDTPWEVSVPIIQCPGNNVDTCPVFVGVASVTVVWMNPSSGVDYTEAPGKFYLEIPTIADDSDCDSPSFNYGDAWPDEVNILDIAINDPNYGESILSIMQDVFSDDNQYEQIVQKLEKESAYGANWADLPLGVLFYENYVSPTNHGDVLNNKISDPGAGYEGAVRWASFVKTFGLKNVDDENAPYQASGIYFLPNCTPHDVAGDTGGENFGIIADRPVLVYHELLHEIK